MGGCGSGRKGENGGDGEDGQQENVRKWQAGAVRADTERQGRRAHSFGRLLGRRSGVFLMPNMEHPVRGPSRPHYVCVAVPGLAMGVARHFPVRNHGGCAVSASRVRIAATSHVPVRHWRRGGTGKHPGAFERPLSSNLEGAHLHCSRLRGSRVRLPVPSVVRALLPRTRHDGACHKRGGNRASHLPACQHAFLRSGQSLDRSRHCLRSSPGFGGACPRKAAPRQPRRPLARSPRHPFPRQAGAARSSATACACSQS